MNEDNGSAALAAAATEVENSAIPNLGPCPFCACVTIYLGFREAPILNYAECCNCLARISGYETPADAMTAWNVRAPKFPRQPIPLRADIDGLSEAMVKFISAERMYCEVIKPALDELNAIREEVIAEIGIGRYFRDPSTGLVYKTQEKKGKWVEFTHNEIIRTKRPDEDRGQLSVKEAESVGYEFEKPKKEKK